MYVHPWLFPLQQPIHPRRLGLDELDLEERVGRDSLEPHVAPGVDEDVRIIGSPVSNPVTRRCQRGEGSMA